MCVDTAEVGFEEGPQASCALLPLSMPDLLGQTGGAVLPGALPAAHAYSGSANPRDPSVRADGLLAGWPRSEPRGPGHLHLPSSDCCTVGVLEPCSCPVAGLLWDPRWRLPALRLPNCGSHQRALEPEPAPALKFTSEMAVQPAVGPAALPQGCSTRSPLGTTASGPCADRGSLHPPCPYPKIGRAHV